MRKKYGLIAMTVWTYIFCGVVMGNSGTVMHVGFALIKAMLAIASVQFISSILIRKSWLVLLLVILSDQ